jgi:hypothetical protein
VYLFPVLNNAPRLLGLLNRNISSCSYGSFDREYWHYNTVDISCARKQEAVLTLTLLYTLKHKENRYYGSREILGYIRAALMFWAGIQNRSGSFNEWYPSEHSFVVTAFSTYAVSESLLLIRNELPEPEYKTVLVALQKAGDWLLGRHEMRVMNQQTGAAIALLNLHLLTNDLKYLDASKDKITLLAERQSAEGWLLEYGGPDIGYLSLAIDYLCKYYSKTEDSTAKQIIDRSLDFIKYHIQPNLIAGGEYTSRNTEYLIPHGFELLSKINSDAAFVASIVRKTLLKNDSFPNLFDDRYLTYVGYTWLQAYQDSNPELDEKVESNIEGHFSQNINKYLEESGMLIVNNERMHLVLNRKKGGAFRLFDKKSGRAYSDSGILAASEGKWYTSGWLSEIDGDMSESAVTISGNMWKVPGKTMTPVSNVLLRLFQMTLGRSSTVSLWMKERLRDLLITKTYPSEIRYNRKIILDEEPEGLLKIVDSVESKSASIASVAVYAKDTHVYVPSSRYYVDIKDAPFTKDFAEPVDGVEIEWSIKSDAGVTFNIKE